MNFTDQDIKFGIYVQLLSRYINCILPCIHYSNFDYEEFSDIKFKIVNNVPSVITLSVEIFQKGMTFYVKTFSKYI